MGTILSSAAVGSAVGILGYASLTDHRSLVIRPVVGLVGIALAVSDLVGRTPTVRRQTCRVWFNLERPYIAWCLWGLDLGLGFTTVRITSVYWFVLFGAMALGSVEQSIFILGTYGFGLALSLLVGTGLILRNQQYSASREFMRREPVLRGALAYILLLASVLLLASPAITLGERIAVSFGSK
jgi:hypothetical protein